MRLTEFPVFSFDCYGTLIDWETGLLAALEPLWSGLHPVPPRNAVLEAFARHEAAQQRETPALHYAPLLAEVFRRLATEWKRVVDSAEAAAFAASVADWPAFPDSAESLQYLQRFHKLVVLSNVDHVSFRGSQQRLGVVFDAVHTAEDIGSYKPDARNFEYLLARVRADQGVGPEGVLHVAQSLFHDHAPANRAGIASAWIDRRHAERGFGATVPPALAPTYAYRFESLAALVDAHVRERRDRPGAVVL